MNNTYPSEPFAHRSSDIAIFTFRISSLWRYQDLEAPPNEQTVKVPSSLSRMYFGLAGVSDLPSGTRLTRSDKSLADPKRRPLNSDREKKRDDYEELERNS